MAAKSRLELILELKDRLFNNKLSKVKKTYTNTVDRMKGKLRDFKMEHVKAFSAIKDEFPIVERGMELLTNKYVLMIAAIVGIGIASNKAYKEAAIFSNEFVQIQNLNLEKPKKELTIYKDLIRDTAFEIGSQLKATSTAFYDVQSATGLYGKEVREVVKQVGDFSIATGADLNDSINSTTKAMKAFGLGVDDLQDILAGNAKTVQMGITTYAQLAKVQTEYAGAARGAGQTIDTANKLFSVFTVVAKDTNIAANMTKTAFEGLTQKGTIDGLKSVGISLYDANGNMREMAGVLTEVVSRFKGMTSEQIDALINKIGGPEGLRNLFVKLKTSSEDFFKGIEGYDASSFDLGKALENAKGDVTILGDIVKNRFNVVLARLGEKILPSVAFALDKVNSFLVWTYDHFEDIKGVLIAIGAGAATYFTPVIASLIASTISAFSLSGALGVVTLGLHAIKTALFSIPIIGWIAAAVTALVIMYQQWDEFRALIDTIAGSLKDFFNGLWEGGKSIIKGLADMFHGLGQIIAGIFTFDGDKIQSGIEKVRSGLKSSLKGTQGIIVSHKAVIQDFGSRYTGNLDEIKKLQAENKLSDSIVPKDTEEDDDGKSDIIANDLNKVVGAGSQVRNITINIDALNKGGINTANTILSQMNPEQIEQWFTEAMMRVMRAAESS